MLKCYFGGSVDPFEYPYVEACFANNQKEAKKLMWKWGRLNDECDGEWIAANIERKPEFEKLLDESKTEAYMVRDPKVLRRMGWQIEGELSCDSCGLSPMDLDEYAVCEECCQCTECGCECEASDSEAA